MIRSTSLRLLSTTNATIAARQSMSTMAAAAEPPAKRLKAIFEDYRQKHFAYETRSRFRHEVVKACSPEGSVIPTANLSQFLHNIGSSHELTEQELEEIVGGTSHSKSNKHVGLPVDKMMQFL